MLIDAGQARNSNDAGPRAAPLRISNSTLAVRPPRHPSSCGSRWPRAPPETTRRTVKDDWPSSHPADLRSRHAILLGARERPARPNFTRKSHQDLETNPRAFSSHLLYHSNTPTPTPTSSSPFCATRITHPQRPPRLFGSRLPRSPLTLSARVSEHRHKISSLLAPRSPVLGLVIPRALPLIIGRKLSWRLQLQIRRRQPGGRTTA